MYTRGGMVIAEVCNLGCAAIHLCRWSHHDVFLIGWPHVHAMIPNISRVHVTSIWCYPTTQITAQAPESPLASVWDVSE